MIKYLPAYWKLLGAPFICVGLTQVADSGDSVGRLADILQTGEDARVKYCDCDNVVE